MFEKENIPIQFHGKLVITIFVASYSLETFSNANYQKLQDIFLNLE